jgi:hypothetical protein
MVLYLPRATPTFTMIRFEPSQYCGVIYAISLFKKLAPLAGIINEN